ncbi:hypothetical protein MKY48_24355 [Paenibacillus sp. FSL W8-0187]
MSSVLYRTHAFNKVCTHSLIYGSQNKHRIIDDHMIKRVIQGELS